MISGERQKADERTDRFPPKAPHCPQTSPIFLSQERVKVVLGDSVTVMIKRIFKFQKLKPALQIFGCLGCYMNCSIVWRLQPLRFEINLEIKKQNKGLSHIKRNPITSIPLNNTMQITSINMCQNCLELPCACQVLINKAFQRLCNIQVTCFESDLFLCPNGQAIS